LAPAVRTINENSLKPGVVAVGNACPKPCPAAGTGTTKVFNDVQLLCNTFIPRWLASEGMDAGKLAAFYNDPEKEACEADCLAKAYHLRSLSIDDALSWRAEGWGGVLGGLLGGRLGAGRPRGFRAGARRTPPR